MHHLDTSNLILSATISEFRRLSGIGRSRIYELLDAGEIESIYVGSRRLILIDSYRRLIERQRQDVQGPAKRQPDAKNTNERSKPIRGSAAAL
jgi:hypothetical protein